jgi:hypothetical protein
MTSVQILDRLAGAARAPSAAVWINGRQAIVAETNADGRISTCEINRGWWAQSAYLAQVVRVIGDRQRVAILGPGIARLALERTYVSTYRRPDRLVDVEPSGPVSREELVDRVRLLAS